MMYRFEPNIFHTVVHPTSKDINIAILMLCNDCESLLNLKPLSEWYFSCTSELMIFVTSCCKNICAIFPTASKASISETSIQLYHSNETQCSQYTFKMEHSHQVKAVTHPYFPTMSSLYKHVYCSAKMSPFSLFIVDISRYLFTPTTFPTVPDSHDGNGPF